MPKAPRTRPSASGAAKAKRPPTAFILFSKAKRSLLAEGLSLAESSKELGRLWKAAGEEERAPFVAEAALLKEKFAEEQAASAQAPAPLEGAAAPVPTSVAVEAAEAGVPIDSAALAKMTPFQRFSQQHGAAGARAAWKKLSQEEKNSYKPPRKTKTMNKRQAARASGAEKVGRPRPKNALSGFFRFASSVREQLTKDNPGAKPQDITTKIGEAWRALSDAEKAPFNEAANAERLVVAEAQKKWDEEVAAMS